MDKITRKLMTMHKALHPKDDIDGVYMSNKEGRGLTSIENSIDALILQFEYFIKKSKERISTVTKTTQTTQKSTEQHLENKNGKKNKSMNISSVKRIRSLSKR